MDILYWLAENVPYGTQIPGVKFTWERRQTAGTAMISFFELDRLPPASTGFDEANQDHHMKAVALLAQLAGYPVPQGYLPANNEGKELEG